MNKEQAECIFNFLADGELHKILPKEEYQEVFNFFTNFNLHYKINEELNKKELL